MIWRTPDRYSSHLDDGLDSTKVYSINSPLVGGFVLGKRNLDSIEFFQPTSDKRSSYERGVMLAQACGCQYQPGSFVTLW